MRRPPIFAILFFLFAVGTLLELALLYLLAQVTGWPFTILLAIVSAIVGAGMARRAGIAVLAQAQRELAAGKFPATSLADGVLILIGGALLITPGLITDVVGFTTLIPACRAVYRRGLMAWARRAFAAGGAGGVRFHHFGGPGAARPDVVDAPEGSWESDETDAPRTTVRSAPVEPKDQQAVDVEFRRVE